MSRTTEAAVKKLIDVETTDDLSVFIETANIIVTNSCGDSDYSDELFEMIERWLSAHVYTIKEKQRKSEAVGEVSVSYESAVDLGFDSSRYGQMAMRLDTDGNLAALNERAKKSGKAIASVVWLGKESGEI